MSPDWKGSGKLRRSTHGDGRAVAAIPRPARVRNFILKEQSGIEGLRDLFFFFFPYPIINRLFSCRCYTCGQPESCL